MDNVKENLAANLRELRKSHSLTQTELAQKLNYSDKSVSKWEKGDAVPDIEVLAAIAEFYNVTIDYLIAPADDTDRAQKAVRQQKKQRSGLKGDKLIITLLAVSVVWILVTVLYANLYLAAGINYWLAFVWSVPASAIILIVFNGIWGRRAFSTVFTSALVWTSLVGLYLQLLEYNMWQLFFVGIPLQIAIVLWSRLGKNQKSNS